MFNNQQIYYIDPDTGDDSNEGLTQAQPIKTYSGRIFKGGDTILFKRGSIIRDVLHTCNGTEQEPVTYGAYGEGDKPAFLGSIPLGDPDLWVEDRLSIWRYTGTLLSEVCNMIYNDGEYCGNMRWCIEDLRDDGDWYYTAIGMNSASEHGFGHSQRDGVLYLYSKINPGLAYKVIECVLWGERKLVGGQSNIILENLSFRNSGTHGYRGESGAKNIIIRNCEFRYIGGAVYNLEQRIRFGNGVELWDGASDITVEGCIFDNIYDSGVTHQGGETRNIPERIYFRNNLFINCGLTAYECREPSREVYFEFNTCINSGGGFSMQGEKPPRQSDPYPQPVGYHVWVWLIDAHTQPGYVYIRHNIFYNSLGAAICLIIDPVDDQQFILDHNCYWKSDGGILIHLGKGAENEKWHEAMMKFHTERLSSINWSGRSSYRMSEFKRYQEECKQDHHSVLAQPTFINEAGFDYRQCHNSPCLDVGIRSFPFFVESGF